jgi:integrase
VGKLGLSRANVNRICLHHFLNWVGPATAVDAIDGKKWLDWYNYLSGAVASGKWKNSHADRIFAVSKRFILFLYEMELCERPRNLDNKNMSFETPPTSIVIWTADEIRKFRATATGQTRLHVLLMLNCGFVGKDISDLRQDEVDWKAGIITRKRSKTRKEADVPVVRYKLWGQSFDLLKEYRSTDPETVLLTTSGKKWIEEHQGGGEYHRSDKVASNFKYLLKRAKFHKPPKALRATAASKLAESPQFKYYVTYFLGHSPRSVAEKHYVRPTDAEFFKALAWLETALGM